MVTKIQISKDRRIISITDNDNYAICRTNKPKVANLVRHANEQFTPYIELIVKKLNIQ